MNSPSEAVEEPVIPSLAEQNREKRWAVQLRVYDTSRGMARTMSPMIMGRQVDGVWHTGVLVYGIEYFYGGGICAYPPAEVERMFQLTPQRIIFMGFTNIGKDILEDFLNQISPRFTEATYDLLHWNCNHFTDELTNFLLNRPIPDFIRNQVQQVAETPMGRLILPLLQQRQQAIQQSAAAAGERTLWTQGAAASDAPYLTATATASRAASSEPTPAAARGSSAAIAAVEGTASESLGQALAPEWPESKTELGKVLQEVCRSDEYGFNTKYVFLLMLILIITNLLKENRDPKFLRLRSKNPMVHMRLLKVRTGQRALELIGFVRKTKEKIATAAGGDSGASGAVENAAAVAISSDGKCLEKAESPFKETKTCENIGESDGDEFVFTLFDKAPDEKTILNRLRAQKQEIEALVAVLDRHKNLAASNL